MSKDGGLAFHGQRYEEVELANGDIIMEMVTHCGMSLRDWFAGQALQGFCANGNLQGIWIGDAAARDAYSYADAMIAERDKEAHNDEERT